MRARVLTNKLYTHIHTVLHTCNEPITIVGTVSRCVQIVNRLMSALGWKKRKKKSIIPLFIATLTWINLMFVDPYIIGQFLQRKPQQDATMYQHFIIHFTRSSTLFRLRCDDVAVSSLLEQVQLG
jgi:hypothetical protein